MRTAIIILAAGNSSRMGKPKQLLRFNGHALLNIVINESLKTTFRPVVVVLGAYAATIKEASAYKDVTYTINEDWENGLSSSISFGLNTALTVDADLENAIITVADQVHISSAIFEELHRKQRLTKKNIVACSYSQTTGTPALFNKKYFDDLLALSGENGAKRLIKQYIDDTATIPFELGKVDIDTETDYSNLINQK
ncbi:nucleotidyltransferase family protein [Pedobacter rhodius]|uniref:Nucleotidyltransferase family protein n=1 Tax=Pedobacter rhodius TaxID=3004098 RepID=A0ABT4L1P4_9SPHI|nr:nucleotidyltransferase family protein [Pedobacter sp. SJ11]MCZ4225110.1 nucleotidyltransferase family protein [Pedobacter sp. SJ11]